MKKSKTLTLIIDRVNFEAIEKGEKTEDYRSFSDFYIKKLCNLVNDEIDSFKEFDEVQFNLGYSKNCRKIIAKIKGIWFDTFEDNIPEDFKKGDQVFTIELGEIIAIV